MGVGIAYVLAVAGYRTVVVEPDAAQRRAVEGEVRAALRTGVDRGKLDDRAAAGALERLSTVHDVDLLPAGLDVAIETVPEDFEIKRAVIQRMADLQPTLLATNTSTLSVDALAAGLASPERFLGLHFFNPVWSIRLVEVVQGGATSQETLDAAFALVATLGKEPAVVHDTPGFATSRLDIVTALEAMRMVGEGVAEAAEIDRAIRLAYRHPVGPLELSDIVGLDVRLDTARALAVALGERFAPPPILVDLVSEGHLGVKTGRGFLDWSGQR
jgi:3-hydroxybutyryl-CoA dehydrogenase